MNWGDLQRLFVEMCRYRFELGWERSEAILEAVREEIEAHTGRHVCFRDSNRIKPRVRKKHDRLLEELRQITAREGAQNAAQFFSSLHRKLRGTLSDALRPNSFTAPPPDIDENNADFHPDF